MQTSFPKQHLLCVLKVITQRELSQRMLCMLQVFTQRELSQLDVYGTWAVIRNRLHTDDSFEFNKTLKGIKDSIEHLPDATQEEEEALQAVKVSHQRSIPNQHSSILQAWQLAILGFRV